MNWTNYLISPPTSAGAYEWRMPSAAVPGITLIAAAYSRERDGRFTTPLDYWTGWYNEVPPELEWRASDKPEYKAFAWNTFRLVGVEGLIHIPCPFCQTTPKINALREYSCGGIAMRNDFHLFNRFWLTCCSWGKTPSYSDPRELEAVRVKAFGKLYL